MPIDFSNCEILTPKNPRELQRLYEMLAEVFPAENKLFEDIIIGAHTLYNWTPYTLYHAGEPAGNVSIVMFQLQAEGRLRKIAGIASVATPECYRGMGIAKHLMNHVLKVIDAQNLPSILFTSLPRVYTGLGYQLVNQEVKQTAAKRIDTADGLPVQRLEHLTREALDTIKRLYSETLTYEGKLLRDEEYWRLYGNAVNNSGKTEFAFCMSGDKVSGYARLEYESDRVLLEEFYTSGESPEINAALWNWVCDAAAGKSRFLVSIALPLIHPLWNFLQINDLSLMPETGVEREVFMVRMPQKESIAWLAELQWPLSDKF
ncbi:MAG: GNAT family N-acetyltransferase [Victivallaceae bacterium]